METNKEHEFYAICPNCKTISGFFLTDKLIKANDKYFCQECSDDSVLSEWKLSTRVKMKRQIKKRMPKSEVFSGSRNKIEIK